MVVLLRHYALSRDISERAALKDFTITLHTDLQNSRFLMHWKIDLMELQNKSISNSFKNPDQFPQNACSFPKNSGPYPDPSNRDF